MSAVYFVWAPQLRRLKIGRTKGDPYERLRQMQTASPEQLELLGWEQDDGRLESAFHRVYADARLHGEWFWPLPCLMERIGYPHLGEYEPFEEDQGPDPQEFLGRS